MVDGPNAESRGYVSAEQIATELGVSVFTVRTAFRAFQAGDPGGLPGRKVGKGWVTTRAALDRWVLQEPPAAE